MGIVGRMRVVFLFLMASGFVSNLMADPRTTVAGFQCNSTEAVSSVLLAQNFVPAMANLSTQVNEDGFGTSIVGEAPNAVFGLAQCFKDLSSIDCQLCFSEIRSILPKCYPDTGGRIFFDGCFGRYENFSFFDQGVDSVQLKNCSSSKNSSQPGIFKEALERVIESVSLKAQKNQGFAVASHSVSNLTLHALAQCWESLDKKTCNSCLQASASSIMSCYPGVDGRSLNAGCYMRYSNEVFWNLSRHTGLSAGRKALYIILGLAVGGFLILAGIGLWKKGHLRQSFGKSLKDIYGSGLSSALAHSQLNFRYQELRQATNNFDSSNKLGQGSYGSVYKGILLDGREVAVKRLFLNTRQWIDQFFNEVHLINQVRHKNLVKLLGYSVDGQESLLVYDYYPNKSLDHFIFDENQAQILDWKKRIDIIQGVAEGLSYLHEESEIRIIHRDIKASNILLDDKLKPKITDFGLARSFAEDQTHLSTGIAGTLGYMAPEYVVHGHLTEKADVYSFGVLLLEILTGQRCSNGTGAKPGQFFLAKIWSHYKAETVDEIMDRHFYDEAVKDEILHAVHVGLLCTQATPSYRPTMAKVVELLRSTKNQENVFPTDPPFLDVLSVENLEEGDGIHLLSGASAPGFSGSTGSVLYGR